MIESTERPYPVERLRHGSVTVQTNNAAAQTDEQAEDIICLVWRSDNQALSVQCCHCGVNIGFLTERLVLITRMNKLRTGNIEAITVSHRTWFYTVFLYRSTMHV